MKRAFTFIVVLLAVGSVFYVFTGKEVLAPSRPNLSDKTLDFPASVTGLVVYYFDMGKDCSTCLNLEAYTRETLESFFGEALSTGAIRWEVVDVDAAENDHFVTDFGLYTKSVVLATYEDGEVIRYNNLSRIWELVYDKEAYVDYVRTQVEEVLGAEA